jgi:hypothetical protein
MAIWSKGVEFIIWFDLDIGPLTGLVFFATIWIFIVEKFGFVTYEKIIISLTGKN